MIANQYSKKMKDIMKRENKFILVDINIKNNTYEYYSVSYGFENKAELRGPRFQPLPNKSNLKILEKIGYDFIVFDRNSLWNWIKQDMGKAIIHKEIINKYFPFIIKPELVVSSAKEGGFYMIDTNVGKKLHRKHLSPTEKRNLYSRYNNRCYLCGSSEKLTQHHILDRRFGGGTEEDNIVPICQKCHNDLNKGKIERYKLMPLRYRNLTKILKNYDKN
jgi:hypothetical protein